LAIFRRFGRGSQPGGALLLAAGFIRWDRIKNEPETNNVQGLIA
jgi:hypothetical protein